MPSPVDIERSCAACNLTGLADHRQRRDDRGRDTGGDDERRQRAHDECADVRAGLLLIARIGEPRLQRARQLQVVGAEHRERQRDEEQRPTAR